MKHLPDFIGPVVALAAMSTLLTACDVIDSLDLGAVGERNDRAGEYSREDSGDEFFASLPMLERQWLMRARSIEDNPSFDPNKRPALVPLNFRQVPWNNEIELLPVGIETKLSSDFGWRGLFGSKDFHSGIDIVADAGTEVYTPVAGEVIHVAFDGKDSGVVLFDGERQHTYWHVTPSKRISLGDYLTVGTTVGTLVPLGRSTHLHYSIHLTGPTADPNRRNDSNAVDPLSLLNL
ncbi:peptidoglycan DD-metalloendopeptidase family protein [Alphaproteobacteria bacterium]|nr:peptidoglycan DD-metalloendopeptidase family protein [Alphaproteobacteria bacterium]